MKRKHFVMTVVTLLALGAMSGSLAAALTSNGEDDTSIDSVVIPGGAVAQGPGAAQPEDAASEGLALPDREELLSRIQSGDISQEELARLREQFQGQRDGPAAPVGGPQVGTIVSIDGNTIALQTGQGEVQATLSDQAVIREFTAGSLEDLVVGQPISIIGQRGETGVTARIIIAVPEGAEVDPSLLLDGLGQGGGRRGPGGAQGDGQAPGQGGFGGAQGSGQVRGQGGFGGRQGGGGFGGALSGTIQSISGNLITIETSQGPLVATVDPDQTLIQVLSEVTVQDLVVDQQVTVTGTAGEDGSLAATSILVTPDLPSLFGGGGFGGGGGAFGG
jgi:hypothetical protein